jgi:hypothetical protein
VNYQPIVFLGIPMLAYAIQSVVVYYAQSRYGMTVCMAAYALANIGLILDAYGI